MTEVLVPTASIETPVRRAGPARRGVGRRVLTFVGIGWLVVVVLAAVLANLIAPYGPNQQDLMAVLQGPSPAHWLGTDTLGRDVMSRLMYGARPSLIAAAIAILVYVIWGSALGLIAGYLGGWTDRVVGVLTSILIALPHIILLFVVLSVYRGNVYLAMFVFGFIASPVMVLLVRGSALSLRNELFVDAAKVSGLSPAYIIFRHILPRSLGLIIVQGTVFGATAIVLESALSFLGFGEQQPAPSWGNMVAEAANQIVLNPWLLYPTGAIIFLTALALGVVGDSLRDRVSGSWTQSTLTKAVRRTAYDEPRIRTLASAPLLSVEGLTVAYRLRDGATKTVVHNVSFDVAKGETVGIVGESGSGKTTVAFGILGVPGDNAEISAGHVWFEGTDLTTLTDSQLARYRGQRIAYVAQEPMVALDPTYRIGYLLRETLRVNEGLTGPSADERVTELLREVELSDPDRVARSYLHELSGGMAQRVSIAFALAGRPDLLVADEPTTALDVTVQAGILALLRRLRESTGLSIVIITHDFGVVADLCDRVVVMYRGEVVETNTAEEIYRNPGHEYTRALLASNPHHAEPGKDLPVITGSFNTPRTSNIPVWERKRS
ncbi:dipeptide/oligopeptide/nickel ABC transporter permease/ATP-binding protein [Subtercola lobariae]|uniref:Dipeptide/oligopeptide/nickel ABC transporter ATP-binding protein n=1 Tax=Subtercola lobariae TaxID=1588641 RepID=A0A917B4L0_9MICO|nr:dipeptide/oligopeptide/nickel ABC transporter permease/ATP-binding protein [Subtercola lobariae]GGF18431.1 dipeptide/oligopeptide/nickel ABC transporter ATP-binding protein [Subtercola lobariae]